MIQRLKHTSKHDSPVWEVKSKLKHFAALKLLAKLTRFEMFLFSCQVLLERGLFDG